MKCRCGKFEIGSDAPHRVHGNDPAVVCYQVENEPKYGREAHTVRECYKEVVCDEAWRIEHKTWVASLSSNKVLPCPMPVGHIMFSPLKGSPSLSRLDNLARDNS